MNDPAHPKPWHIVVMSIIFLPPMLLAVLWVFGAAVEGVAKHSEDRERCLRNATNGLEIRDCR